MNKLILTIVSFFGFLSLSISPTLPPSITPESWPQTMTIEVFYGNGMMNASALLHFSAGDSWIDDMKGGKRAVTHFVLSESDKKQLLGLLKKYRFAQIRSADIPGIIYDKATTRISVFVREGVQKSIESGATVGIEEQYANDFSDLYRELGEFAKAKVKEQKVLPD